MKIFEAEINWMIFFIFTYSTYPPLPQSHAHEELLCFKSGGIKDFRALLGGFKNEGIFRPLVLIIGSFSRFPSAQKPPLSASVTLQGRVFTSLGRDGATCKAGFILQKEDAALFLQLYLTTLCQLVCVSVVLCLI